MQGMSDSALDVVSNLASCALACAGRHTGPSTTSLKLSTHAVRRSLFNLQDQPKALTSPSILAGVRYLNLRLHTSEYKDDDEVRQFACSVLLRLPNLVAAKLSLDGSPSAFLGAALTAETP